MTSIIKRTAGVLMAIILASSTYAQKVDQDRMDRDLAIAEDILISLIKNGNDNIQFFRTSASSTYLPDYGVIFNISGSGHLVGEDFGTNFTFSFDGDDFEDFNYVYNYDYNYDHDDDDIVQAERQQEREEREEEHEQEHERERERAREIAREAKEKVKMSFKGKEAEMNKSGEVIKEAMKVFLTDYADLIGQLKTNHRIMITSSGSNWTFGPVHVGSRTGKKVSAEIVKGDIASYKSGKLSREALMNKITFTETEKSTKKETDLELLSSIFRRLYKPDLSDTYYLADRLSYERLANFGVIYKLRMYSSSSDRDGKHTITTLGLSGLSDEERNKKVAELYPKFEQTLKENLLEYGKTVKSLGRDEILMFKVKLTQCKGCDMPKNIDVSVKQGVLSDYSAGKLSKNAALEKINVKQYKN